MTLRGIMLFPLMLVLTLMTIMAVPLISGESPLGQRGSDVVQPTMPVAALALCERLAVARAKAHTLVEGVFGPDCMALEQVRTRASRSWHISVAGRPQRAVELWVVRTEPRTVHIRPLLR